MLLKVVAEATGEVLEVRVHPGSTVDDLRSELQSRLGLAADVLLPLRAAAGAPPLEGEVLLGEWSELLAGTPTPLQPLASEVEAVNQSASGAETAKHEERQASSEAAGGEPAFQAPPEVVLESSGPELPARAQSEPAFEACELQPGASEQPPSRPETRVPQAEEVAHPEAASRVAPTQEPEAGLEVPGATRVGWWEDLPEMSSEPEDQAAQQDLSLVSVATGGTGGPPVLPGEVELLEAGTGGEMDPAKQLELLRNACERSSMAVAWCSDTDALRMLLRTARRWDAASVRDLKRECTVRKVPFEGVMEKEEMRKRLRQALVWDSMPDRVLEAECRAQGLPPKVGGASAATRDSRMQQLIQLVYGQALHKEPPPQPPKEKGASATAKQPSVFKYGGAKSASSSRAGASQPPQRRPKSPPQTERMPFPETRPKSPGRAHTAKFGRASTTDVLGAPKAPPERPASAAFKQSAQTFTSAAAAKPNPKARPKSVRPKAAPRARDPEPDGSDNDCPFGTPNLRKYGPRVRRAIKKFPSYQGDMPPDPQEAEELWTDQDLHNFFFSSGFIRPKKKNVKPRITKAMIEAHYKTLGLKSGEKLATVRAKYRKLALEYHPDKNKDSRDATERMQGITEAYGVICQFLEVEAKAAG